MNLIPNGRSQIVREFLAASFEILTRVIGAGMMPSSKKTPVKTTTKTI